MGRHSKSDMERAMAEAQIKALEHTVILAAQGDNDAQAMISNAGYMLTYQGLCEFALDRFNEITGFDYYPTLYIPVDTQGGDYGV